MKVLILGIDGYIGHSLALHLLRKDHYVYGLDNYSRRRRVNALGSDSLTPILPTVGRNMYLRKHYDLHFNTGIADLTLSENYHELAAFLRITQPDAIVHLAEQPSAAWSMASAEYAGITQFENIVGTLHLLWAMRESCPSAHLIKLGTMGEYGTPSCDIPEGRVPGTCLADYCEGIPAQAVPCPMRGLMFPRTAGSFYHLSKVHDTHNIEFSCRNWGLRSTDIMQGVVFGLNEAPCNEELTRFDYDECFGTVLNRFCTQAIIGHDLTIYGEGNQTRGYLPLKDSLQCLTIALENPPPEGEYRTFNQFESTYSINQLANLVSIAAADLGLTPLISHIPNPRKEAESHYYNPTHQKLFDLGYVPTTNILAEITDLIGTLLLFKDRVHEDVIMPEIKWK